MGVGSYAIAPTLGDGPMGQWVVLACLLAYKVVVIPCYPSLWLGLQLCFCFYFENALANKNCRISYSNKSSKG